MNQDYLLSQRLAPNPQIEVNITLPLTAEERIRSRTRWQLPGGVNLFLRLPRGTVLRHNDLLHTKMEDYWVRVVAKPEPVLTVTATTTLDLLRAAYHLGNRHIAIEITPHYLRLSPDPVLQRMLEQLKLQVCEEIAPFEPERGAYHHFHGSDSE